MEVSRKFFIKIEDCEIVNIDPTQSPVQLLTNIRHELYLNQRN